MGDMENDRHWMYIPRRLPEFDAGVIDFLKASFATSSSGGQILCPCKRCKNRYWYRGDEVFDHLKGYRFVDNYYVWVFHGEALSRKRSNIVTHDDSAKKMKQMKNCKTPQDESVTDKLIKKVNGGDTSYIILGDLMESLKARVEVLKNELVDMRRELEEDYERKKAELEAIQKDFDKLVEDELQKLIKKLPPGVARELLK